MSIIARIDEKIKLFENGYAFILDENSNVIYHPQMDSTLQYGEKVAIDSPDQVVGDHHVRYHFDGTLKEACWVPLSNGMRLYVTVPLAEINSIWQRMISRTIFAAFIILLIASFVMMRFATSITKPLHNLAQAAQQVADGNYDVVLEDNNNDEIGILTRSFMGLVEKTKANIDNLNRKVYFAAMNSQSLWKMKISATGISSLICSANIGTKYVPQQNTSGNRLIYPWALPCTTRNLTLP